MTQQMLIPIRPVDDDAIRDLTAIYSIHDPTHVYAVLSSLPYLVPILLELPDQVRRAFGHDRPMRLDISTDPEFPRDTEIFVYVDAESDTENAWTDAERRIRQLHSHWLSRLPRDSTRGLNLEVE